MKEKKMQKKYKNEFLLFSKNKAQNEKNTK